MHPYNWSLYPTDSYKFLENNCKKNWVCSLRRKSAWEKGRFMLYWLLRSGLNQNLLLPNSEMPKGHSHLHLPPSLFQEFCHLGREGTSSPRHSTALPLSQPELPDLELFFFLQNSGDPPQLQLEVRRRSVGQQTHACETCSGRGRAKQNEFICLGRGVKTRRLLFQAAHGLKYRHTTEH